MTWPICHKVQLLLSGRGGESGSGAGTGGCENQVLLVPELQPGQARWKNQAALRRKPLWSSRLRSEDFAVGSSKHVKLESQISR